VGALVIPEHRAAPLEATAFKAAAGALEHLPVVIASSIAGVVDALRRLEVWTVGLDAGSERSLFGLDLLAEPVAVVVGAEGAGLSRLVRERVDVLASLPLFGPVESLNASVAAALAVFEVARVRMQR
jgi:23S rRNA (guanosine2251-2'-O)-methyltransferase